MMLWLLLLTFALTLFQMFSQGQDKYEKKPFSPDFVRLVEDGKIRKAEIVMEVSGLQFIRGELAELDPRTGHPKRFKTDVLVTDDLKRAFSLSSSHRIRTSGSSSPARSPSCSCWACCTSCSSARCGSPAAAR